VNVLTLKCFDVHILNVLNDEWRGFRALFTIVQPTSHSSYVTLESGKDIHEILVNGIFVQSYKPKCAKIQTRIEMFRG